MTDVNDPLALAALFEGGAEAWRPILQPTIERQPEASTFIGPSRSSTVVPVRELTFQALKPNPPERWTVVIFGQNPYPRAESATGIAMFDNSFRDWKDARFGKVTSIRCIVKAACMWKHGVPKATSTDAVRTLLAKHDAVDPPAWFQAMLSQGVLLLNASLTASSDDSLSTARHTTFWRPVIEQIIRGILEAKQASPDPSHRGVVFAWWGNHAKALRTVVDKLAPRYPGVRVKHVDHCNPAAMGDAFCEGAHFETINDALRSVGSSEIDWLPARGWEHHAAATDASRMGEFISSTMELHRLYLERLQAVGDERGEELATVEGLLGLPALPFGDAVAPLVSMLPRLSFEVNRSLSFASKTNAQALSRDEIAALYLYTTESALYRQLNATLRHPDRARISPYRHYLRLFLSALSKLSDAPRTLYRGVALDLRAQYPEGRTVVWWGVSSCTANPKIARGFLGSKGRRILFEITPRSAVGIGRFSAFTAEDEFILSPGTQLRVRRIVHEPDGLTTAQLEELEAPRLVC